MKKQFYTLALILLLGSMFSSCNSGGGGSSAKADVPDVRQNGCVPESDLMKPPAKSNSLVAIVGGDKVHNHDPDSKKVAMLYTEDRNGGTSICTATPIAPNVLLTAAHCLADDHAAIFNSSISCESGFNIQTHMGSAIDAVMHPDYKNFGEDDPKVAGYDIALVILKKNIPSPYRIMKIANPDAIDFTKGHIQLIGYGSVNFNAGGAAILRKTSLPSKQFSINKNNNWVDINQSYGHGVCSGDSGGPSFANVDGEDQILGVNSYVYGSFSEKEACNVYARQAIAYGHIPWIKQELAKYGIFVSF